MTGYIIKSTATATKENPNFYGQEKVHYILKGGYVFGESEIVPSYYAYKSKKVAENQLKKIKEDHDKETANYGYWTYKDEVIEVELIG